MENREGEKGINKGTSECSVSPNEKLSKLRFVRARVKVEPGTEDEYYSSGWDEIDSTETTTTAAKIEHVHEEENQVSHHISNLCVYNFLEFKAKKIEILSFFWDS